jgi:hypothetical protein
LARCHQLRRYLDAERRFRRTVVADQERNIHSDLGECTDAARCRIFNPPKGCVNRLSRAGF